MLQPGSVTHAFICDAYHHFDRYPEMLASILAALQSGDELVVVGFDRIPGISREWLLTHVWADKKTVRQEFETAGFRLVEDVPVAAFKENYLLRFRKPDSE
jgi:predicted methyltransferase